MKKNFYLPLIVFLLMGSSYAQECKTPVDENKVILFLDANDSKEEIVSARSAACKRGQRLEVIQGGQGSMSQNLQAQLQDIKSRGASLENLTISGHNGGGAFSGTTGTVSKHEIQLAFEQFPELAESLESLHLLGCYTVVPSEIFDWKNTFPELKIIGGYDGSGPLSSKPAAQTYIEDILMIEEDLIYSAEQNELQDKIKKGFRHIHYLNSAIYVEPLCGPNVGDGNLYRQQASSDERMTSLNMSECQAIVNGEDSKTREYEKALTDYHSGAVEIPQETSGTLLREIYSFSRQNSHCFEMMRPHHMLADPDALLMLLFFHDVKKNFGHFFDQNLDSPELREQLDNLTPDSLNKKKAQKMTELKKEIEEEEEEIEFLTRNGMSGVSEQYDKLIEERMGELSQAAQDFLEENPNFLQADGYMGGYAITNGMRDEMDQLYEIQNMHRRRSLASEAPSFLIAQISGKLEYRKMSIQQIETKSAEDIIKLREQVWMPTYENIKNKSRREVSQNIHKMVELKQSLNEIGALEWAEFSQATNLMQRALHSMKDLPFEWHEEMENPPHPFLSGREQIAIEF